MEQNKVDQKAVDEICCLKKEKKASWRDVYRAYKRNGGLNEYGSCYGFRQGIFSGSVADLDGIIKWLKDRPVPDNKKPKSINLSQRCKDFEGRRLVRVYAKEKGLFGLQREYLE